MESRLTILLENNANFVKMTLGDSTREIDVKTACGLIAHLKEWVEWREHWAHFARYYKEYSLEKIDEFLDDCEKGWDDEDEKEYEVGENFASFLNVSTESGMANNGKASEIVKLDWEKEFPALKNKIDFDTESSYCYVYTKEREVASKFLWWSYNKYIKGHLDDFNV